MKKITGAAAVIATFLLCFILPSAGMTGTAAAINNSTEVGNELYQGQQMVGGQQYMIFNSPPAKIPRQFINPYADADFLYPPPPLYPKGWYPWLGAAVVPADKLYPLKRAIVLAGHFQWSGLARYPANNDSIYILPAKPRGPNDTPIFTVQIDSPEGGLLEEAVKRALSLAKGYSGGRRAYVEYKINLIPQSSGLSVSGSATNSNVISDGSALAFAAVPMLGWARTKVLKSYTIKVHCYNDGSVSRPASSARKTEISASEALRQRLPLIFFDFDKYVIRPDQRPKLGLYARWVEDNWRKIMADDHFILFIGGCDIRGPEGYNDTLGMLRAKAVMLEVGSLLLRNGWPEERLERYLRYVSAGKRQPQFRENRKNRHTAMVEAKELSVNPGDTARTVKHDQQREGGEN